MEGSENPECASSSTQPFWERYGISSEQCKSEAGCSYTSFINVQCRLEEEDGSGRPRRKCERLIRKFRDCGRGREEIESTTEEIIDHNYKPGSRDLLSGGQPHTPHAAPLDANVGEALEEFVEYAEKLKRKAASMPDVKQGLAMENAPSQRHLPEDLPYSPWYSRFFHRHAQCSPGRQRPWENFKEDFQEV